jgi:HEAT repeat protein
VVIKASLRQQIDTLLQDLADERDDQRESAIARLTLIGGRAVSRLMALVDEPESPPSRSRVRAGALRALEGISDARAIDTAARAVEDPDSGVVSSAVGVLRVFLGGAHSPRAVEPLIRLAVDRGRPDAMRLSAIAALGDLDASTLKPLVTALADDPSMAVRSAVALARPSPLPLDDVHRLKAAAEGRILDDPAAVRAAVVAAGDRVPLPLLRALVDRVREQEATESGRRSEWIVVRAAAHAALARRGSRLALYDVREALEAASAPLPVEFLTALSMLGDVSCLEAIAAAFARTTRVGPTGDDWWRRHLLGAFRAIVARERLTHRHAVMRKILKKWPDIVATRD